MTDLDDWTFERSGDCWIGRNAVANRRTALKGTETHARADAEAGRVRVSVILPHGINPVGLLLARAAVTRDTVAQDTWQKRERLAG